MSIQTFTREYLHSEMSDGHWQPYSFTEWKGKMGNLKNYMNYYGT